jgi:Ca-activated chloride channel family protein
MQSIQWIQWGAPHLLHLLWLLPPLAALVIGLTRWREHRLRSVLDEKMLATCLPPQRRRRLYTRLALWLTAAALGVTALARPQWGEVWTEVQHQGLDILIVLDTSNSMRAEDIRPNRLERAKLGIRDMIRQLHGDRVGLIPFAGASYLYCPLTADYGAFTMLLDDVHPGIIPRGGTAIARALREAIRSFDNQITADKAIILITDGEDHETPPRAVLEELRDEGIRLFAVGVGTPDGDVITITDQQGQTQMLRDQDSQVVLSRLQESDLEQLATGTGGMYVRATPTDFGLEQIFDQGIAPLQRQEMDTEMLLTYQERYAWFLAPALLLLLIEALLRDGRPPRRRTT